MASSTVPRPASRLAGAWLRPAAAAALIALWLGACVSYHARPLHPQQNARTFAARRLDSPALREAVTKLLPQPPAQWPPPHWSRADLLAVALADNPRLAVARADVGRALAHQITAGEEPNPTIGLQSEYALHDTPWLYGIAFELPLRSPTLRRLAISQAQIAVSRERWELLGATWTVRSELVAALSDWQSALRRSALLDGLIREQQQLLQQQRARVAAGEDAPATLVAVQDALLQAQQEQGEARADAQRAQSDTAAALGLPPQALDGLQLDWPDWGTPPPVASGALQEARASALLSRGDLSAAIDGYAEAENGLRQAIARQYPQFTATPGYYWDHGIHKFPLDFDLTLPLFNRNRGEIAEARAGRELAGQRMLALQDEIYGQIAAAERAESIARENENAAQRRLQSAQEQLRQARLGLKLGAIDRSEQLAAGIAATRARLDLLQTQARWQAARDALEDALRAPLSGPELSMHRSTVTSDSSRRESSTGGRR
ncbi:MAG TPA: TolC family protein [Steroidobacteraceae bacterium]|nr:TolC family protein [Steroidobacteraceae bacterium]